MLALVGTPIAVLAVWVAVPAYQREKASTTAEMFRSTRRDIHARRASHTAAAASLFSEDLRLEKTTHISHSSWRLANPVPLENVSVTYVDKRKRPAISGGSTNATRLLPTAPGPSKAKTYSDVISGDSELRPDLWWDAASYDLLTFIPDGDVVHIDCSVAQYFEMFDVCEAVAHEYVSDRRNRDEPRSKALRLRSEIGDPFDIGRRPFVPAIPTLVLLQPDTGPPTFVLHARDGEAVASASGMRHVFGGQFQPSSRHSTDPAAEADLWLSVARELAEELLGADGTDGHAGGPLLLTNEPLASLESLRRDGRLKVWLLGLGLDPLTLWPDLLTVTVISDDAFRIRFPKLSIGNTEGLFVGSSSSGGSVHGFEFLESVVDALASNHGTHPAAAACLRLAWRHRNAILGNTADQAGVGDLAD